jgi:hypothetical protein
MLNCVCLRILASSRIPRYDLGRQNPLFFRWFCHNRPLWPFSGDAFAATTSARAHRYTTTSEPVPSTSSPGNRHRLPTAQLRHRGGPLSISPNLPNSSNLSSPTLVMLLTPFPMGPRPPARRNWPAPPPPRASPVSSVVGRNAQGGWAAWPSRPRPTVGWAQVHNTLSQLSFDFFWINSNQIQINSEFD